MISNKLFTCIFHGVFTEIQVMDLPCNVHWPFVITYCFDVFGVILIARNFFLLVRKCLSSLFHVQPIQQLYCHGKPRIMSLCRLFRMMKTSLNSTLPNLNFTCTSPMGPRLLPSAETTFLLVGNNLTCCCMEL